MFQEIIDMFHIGILGLVGLGVGTLFVCPRLSTGLRNLVFGSVSDEALKTELSALSLGFGTTIIASILFHMAISGFIGLSVGLLLVSLSLVSGMSDLVLGMTPVTDPQKVGRFLGLVGAVVIAYILPWYLTILAFVSLMVTVISPEELGF
jgi:hypothetical protein